MQHLGVIIISTIFGNSLSMREYSKKISKGGFLVSLIDIYQNHPKYHRDKKTPPRNPRCLNILLRSNEVMMKIFGEIAMSFRKKIIFDNIKTSIQKMNKAGARKICIIGFGLGGSISLNYAQKNMDKRIRLILSFYPHLVHSIYDMGRDENSLNVPDLEIIDSSLKVVIFHGDKDDVVDSGNLKKAREYASVLPNVELVEYKNAKHGFAEKFIQGWIPNLPYFWFCPANWRAHRLSWKRTMKELKKLAET